MKHLLTLLFLLSVGATFAQVDNVAYNKTYEVVSPSKREYKLVVPKAKETKTYTEDKVYYHSEKTQSQAYNDDWDKNNPTYNRLIAEQYRNNSTNPFESEVRQMEYVGKTALTSQMLKFISPHIRVY